MSVFEDLSTPDQLQHLQEIASNALQAWDLEPVELSLLKFRENAVYRVATSEGNQYALRIHRPGYHSDAALDAELQWIRALAEAGIEVPDVIPTPEGELFVLASGNVLAEKRQVDLFAWVSGQPLGAIDLSSEPGQVVSVFTTIGREAALLHNQACSWNLPQGFQRHAWDAEGLVGDLPFWGRFWELPELSEQQRGLINRARKAVAEGLQRYGQSADNYSMIHADLVPENLMVDGDHVRVIDFDDAGFGWHLFELATALYFVQGEDYFDAAREALIAGYRQLRPLSDSDVALLPLFLTARGLTYLGWVQSRRETETAREMTGELIEMACQTARTFMDE
jgi:Ser/Thr protein kinase RdoA (MazF antagonist)